MENVFIIQIHKTPMLNYERRIMLINNIEKHYVSYRYLFILFLGVFSNSVG